MADEKECLSSSEDLIMLMKKLFPADKDDGKVVSFESGTSVDDDNSDATSCSNETTLAISEDGATTVTSGNFTSDKSSSDKTYDYINDPRFTGEQEYYDSSSDESNESILMYRPKKYEDPITRLGNIKRRPDVNGKRCYHMELSIDRKLARDQIKTKLHNFCISKSGLTIVNEDGDCPKSAEDCENFKNAFIEVKKSPLGGYGQFAVCDIDAKQPILVERELLAAGVFDLHEKLDLLTPSQQAAYNRLHANKKTPNEDERVAKWRTNSFGIGSNTKGAVFLVGSRFNHACKPVNNVEYSYDKVQRCIVFVAKRRITAGEELTIRYAAHPHDLWANWGFRCQCGACPGITDAEIQMLGGGSPWGDDV
ncbi:hypothetical protein F5Y16DRAFT_422880 [Xylariaceae sp. FL0255]|nr:hypothetical protein F5Y16DRAFT_422880 [Xylariaceae sp. FL0255]